MFSSDLASSAVPEAQALVYLLSNPAVRYCVRYFFCKNILPLETTNEKLFRSLMYNISIIYALTTVRFSESP